MKNNSSNKNIENSGDELKDRASYFDSDVALISQGVVECSTTFQIEKYPIWWHERITLRMVWIHKDKNILLKFLVMILYICDVFSDLSLALEYMLKKQFLYGALTMVFIWIPSLFVTYDSFRRKTQQKMNNWKNILICIPMVLFGLEPVFCYIQYISYSIRLNMALKYGLQKEIEKYCEQMMDQGRDVVDLKLYEACMEAIPQLILQLSIILKKYGDMQYDITLLLQITSVIFSLGGVALTIVTWIQEVATAQHCKITGLGLIVWSTGRLATLVCRVLAITGSISICPIYTLLGLLIHWFFASFWHYYLYHKVYKNIIVSMAVGILNTFLSRVDNLLHANISLLVLIMEDIIMVTIWILFEKERIKNSPIFIPFLYLTITSSVLGSVSSTMYIYYQKYFMIGENSSIKLIKQ